MPEDPDEYPEFWALVNAGSASVYPHGLCGNRADHDPHVHKSLSLGRFWCTADQSKRLPYALEARQRGKT